jgi:selenocysteine lyase/cysteine desulfurase
MRGLGPTPEVARAAGTVDWGPVTEAFALDREWSDFTAFMLSSHPRPVRDAIAYYSAKIDERPEWAELEALKPPDQNRVFGVKKALSGYLGGQDIEFALAPNTTTGLGLLFSGLQVRPGDEILMTAHDHYSQHESARRKAEKCGAAVRLISLYDDGAPVTDDQLVDRVRAGLTERTRVVGLTWVHSGTGVRMPIRKAVDAIRDWCGSRSAPLIVVDGAHGVGVIDDDLPSLGADFVVSGIHKWLHGPRGTGFVWGRADRWRYVESTVPTFELDGEVFEAWVRGTRLRPGRASFVSPGGFVAYEYLYAVPHALSFLADIGRSAVSSRIAELNTRLREGLHDIAGARLITPLSAAQAAGIVCFTVPGLANDHVVSELGRRRVRAASTPYPRSYVRLAATIANTYDDIDRALTAVADIASSLSGAGSGRK